MRITLSTALAVCTLWAGASVAGEKKTQRLYGLDWHASLPQAFDDAKSRKEQKPVLWLRMLGDLAGKT
jgi:hypothetical protein